MTTVLALFLSLFYYFLSAILTLTFLLYRRRVVGFFPWSCFVILCRFQFLDTLAEFQTTSDSQRVADQKVGAAFLSFAPLSRNVLGRDIFFYVLIFCINTGTLVFLGNVREIGFLIAKPTSALPETGVLYLCEIAFPWFLFCARLCYCDSFPYSWHCGCSQYENYHHHCLSRIIHIIHRIFEIGNVPGS